MRYRGWRTGLASMRAAKLTKTWRQRVRRLGRRKPETILKLGESPEHMVVVTDRLHDLDWVEHAAPMAPNFWWQGRDGAIRRCPDKRWPSPSEIVSVEINATSELGFLRAHTSSQILVEQYHHDGRGWCFSQCSTSAIRRVGYSARLREEVFVRYSLVLVLDDVDVGTDMLYADFLQMDTSSFVEGWKRWIAEWILYARVSVFGDR